MVYSEEKSGGLVLPLIVILLAMAGILAVLVATGGRQGSTAGRGAYSIARSGQSD
ncbi:hypothetical protein [Rhizobium leguminosarum]|uniref:hypothetical protein n=1 Tax=Rhizobium leguminosarum TaxID=384 RepID=UPI001442004A|nr:hypothetical protein [Rhizobium leguminosarum]